MMGVEVTGKARVKGSEVYLSYTAMYEAHFKDIPLDILVLNGPSDEFGSEGYRFWGKVFTWSEDQSLGAVLFKDFSVKPCIPEDVTQPPKKADVLAPGGPVTYLDIGLGT